MAEGMPQVPKQMLEFQKRLVKLQKSAFDNTFKAIEAFQDQQAKLIGDLVEQAPNLPEEARQALRQWDDSYKQGRNQFRESMDKSFDLLESYFDRLTQGGDRDSSESQ